MSDRGEGAGVRAARVEAFGGIESLHVRDLPEPAPAPGELLLDVRACGLNFADIAQRQGLYPGGPQPPFTPGLEAAGIVAAVGPGVSPRAVGARVVAVARAGLLAQLATVPASSCWEWPAPLTFEQGAAFPVSYLTAHEALVRVARVGPGDLAVIHAAAGALGSAAVGVARMLGLRVIGTAGSPDKRERVRRLRVECVADYDDFAERARELSEGRGADVVLDGVGGPLLLRSLASLAPLGRLVVVGLSGGVPPALDVPRLLFRSQGVLGYHLSALYQDPETLRSTVERLQGWLLAGALDVQPWRVLPLAELRHAHELLAGRVSMGKIVLIP